MNLALIVFLVASAGLVMSIIALLLHYNRHVANSIANEKRLSEAVQNVVNEVNRLGKLLEDLESNILSIDNDLFLLEESVDYRFKNKKSK